MHSSNGTVVNRTWHSINEGSLETSCTIPLKGMARECKMFTCKLIEFITRFMLGRKC